MKEYDRVKLTVEKEKYAKDGAHKGMVGWICDPRNINGQWLVCFDECDLETFPLLEIKENDLEVVWESHERQVGDKVLFLSEQYKSAGVTKGLKGILIAKSENNKWTIHFHKQDGLQQECDLTVDGNDFIVD